MGIKLHPPPTYTIKRSWPESFQSGVDWAEISETERLAVRRVLLVCSSLECSYISLSSGVWLPVIDDKKLVKGQIRIVALVM